MKDDISIAVTGLAWMGSGIGSIESAMEQLFRESEHEILITSYALSSAADIFMDWLEASLAKGILIRIAINKFSNQPADIVRRITGMMIKFEDNAVVVLKDEKGNPKGTIFKGPIAKEVADRWPAVAKIASIIV